MKKYFDPPKEIIEALKDSVVIDSEEPNLCYLSFDEDAYPVDGCPHAISICADEVFGRGSNQFCSQILKVIDSKFYFCTLYCSVLDHEYLDENKEIYKLTRCSDCRANHNAN